MPRTIQINMYNLEEACKRLAELKSRPKPYTRAAFYKLVKRYKPEIIKAKARISEPDIFVLASSIRKPGRPPKTVDKK